LKREFEWDENKEEINIRKHDVNFSEAQEAFYDENAIDDYDEFHSNEEQRFALIGLSSKRLLFVSYTIRQNTVIHLISARKANQNQERFYNNAKRK
jgi:uncharacterized DUF497 family protein